MEYGLSENKAMEALTKTPATLLGVYDKVGSIDAGKLANFLITSGPIFNEKTIILQNWVQGIKYTVKEDLSDKIGTYNLVVNTPAGTENYTLDVKSGSSATMFAKDTLNSKLTFDGKIVKLSYAPMVRRQRPAGAGAPDGGQRPAGGGFPGRGAATADQVLPANATRLTGISNGTEWNGTGTDSLGNSLTWTASFVKAAEVKPDTAKRKMLLLSVK